MKTRLGKLAAQNSRSLAFAASFVAAVVIASVISELRQFSRREKVAPHFATGFDSDQSRDSACTDLTFVASRLAPRPRMSLQPGDEVRDSVDRIRIREGGTQAPRMATATFNRFPLIEYRGDRARSYVALKRGTAAEKQWKFPDAYGAYRADVDVTAPVVFAGYGITAPETTLRRLSGHRPVHGKIVLLFDHEPQETDPSSIFNGTGNTRYATTRVKVLNAQTHGAVGVLIVGEPNRKHPSNQERAARIGGAGNAARDADSSAIDCG